MQLALAAVLLPFAAFIINFLLPKTVLNKGEGLFSTVCILFSLICSCLLFAKVWARKPIHEQVLWFQIGTIKIYAGLLLNNLSVLMLPLVSGIALAVHIYSVAYMHDDLMFRRYFRYLSFFCFAMMALVVSDNLLLMYAFWELVGFASYLLIGFWFTREKAVQANKKAFIMNRIGDIGFLIGIMILFAHFHTFDLITLFNYPTNFSSSGNLSGTWLIVAGICFFLGATAKSAQFPLHTWLPDAMEGPTSVSALIHAATMVAAGVFLLARVYPVFNPDVKLIITIVGTFTAFMAATIALTQNDLKKILAYSTISQLGFMVAAMGIGAYASSLFHLATHAFFKCLLFLSAGVIIHEMQHIKEKLHLDIDPQNILYMGGLRKVLPITFITCIIAALALIGFPLTSGYLSKDGILIQAFEWAEGRSFLYQLIPIFILITSWLTAFYISRLLFKVFWGESRLKEMIPTFEYHPSKENKLFTWPMLFLSVFCLFPFFSLNPLLYEHAWLFRGFLAADYFERENIYHTIIPAAVNLITVPVVYLAYARYINQNIKWFPESGFLFRLSYNHWYIDQFYQNYIAKSVVWTGRKIYAFDLFVIDGLVNLIAKVGLIISQISNWLDKYIIDGAVNFIAFRIRDIGSFARGFQTGKVQQYLLTMLIFILSIYIFKILI
ncbi:NADH-quinone oxidoreductase subunit L [Mucilaginibacter sp. HMF7410]|uniref:NADH-quinone oxidoreductase subunit L n=1 Tax=Mucilaginibacter arboris TaxID=2682090 RepID=A0A7K1SUB4_9SPHI|nr:NADH-quinone oxidoreductase subunit L [Mucilaginibacter arboris]